MNQKSSVVQILKSVPQALTSDTSYPAKLLGPRPKCARLESEELRRSQIRLPELPVKDQMLPQHRHPPYPPRGIRNCSGLRAALRCIRIQPDGPETPKEGRDALRPPQTHPRVGPSPITRPMWRPGRIYPRSYRPKPPETGKAQANGARRCLKTEPGTSHSIKSAQ